MSNRTPIPGVLSFKRKDDLRDGMAALDGGQFWFWDAGVMDDGPYKGQRVYSFCRRHDAELGRLAAYWVPACDIKFNAGDLMRE
jgi:hypothetical protein